MKTIIRYMNLNIAGTICLFVILCLISASCSNNESNGSAGLVTLLLKIDTGDIDEAPAVRSGSTTPGETGESDINKLKIFAFESGGTLEQYASIEITGGTSTDPMWDSVNGALRVVLTPGAKRIYCIANWEDNTSAGMPLLNNTLITDSATLINTLRNHSVVLSNPPVMSGRLTVTLTGAELSQTVKLERQVARVEIFPMLSEELNAMNADVKLKGLSFRSMADRSYLFRRYPQAGPSSITPWNQSGFTGAVASMPVTQTVKASATRYDKLYYVPEYIITAQAGATWMILETEYNGEPVYYTMYVNPTGDGTTAHPAYTIERNHTYRMYITIQGKGSATLPTAATRGADEAFNNLTCELEIK